MVKGSVHSAIHGQVDLKQVEITKVVTAHKTMEDKENSVFKVTRILLLFSTVPNTLHNAFITAL